MDITMENFGVSINGDVAVRSEISFDTTECLTESVVTLAESTEAVCFVIAKMTIVMPKGDIFFEFVMDFGAAGTGLINNNNVKKTIDKPSFP